MKVVLTLECTLQVVKTPEPNSLHEIWATETVRRERAEPTGMAGQEIGLDWGKRWSTGVQFNRHLGFRVRLSDKNLAST